MTPNDWADFWRERGFNVIPADTQYRKKYPEWERWQNNPIPKEQHEKWKRENAFEKGMAIIPGKVWFREDKKEYYLVCIDLDNRKGIDEICSIFEVKDLEELSKITLVEFHKDNPSRCHVYFYSKHIFKKKSSDMKKLAKDIEENKIPSIEVKGLGSHGISFCCPSPHKDGYNYEIKGTLEPGTFGEEIEEKLFEIYKKYDLLVGKNGQIPIRKLFESDFVVKEGHNRHEALLRIMESLLQRNKSILSNEQIKQLAWNWNLEHCKPPLNDNEFDRQWKDANRFIEKNNNGTRRGNLNIKGDFSINDNNEKDDFIYKIVGYNSNPLIYYIDNKTKEIRYGILVHEGIVFKKSVIDAVPTRIVVYNNPIFPRIQPIEIEFSNGSKIGPFNNVSDIIKALENKGHILNKYKANDALNSIISAFNDNHLIEYKEDVTTPGYYYIENKIIPKDVTQSVEIRKEDAEKCCDYLNELAETGWKNKNIFPTVLKWGIISPFSFIIKQSTDNYMHWLQLYGQGQTGKTTLGYIVLSIWNLKARDHSLGFNHIDTVPRFGNNVSRDTYPKLVNEVGALSTNSYSRYTAIIEMVKHSIESITARGKHLDSGSSGGSTGSYQEIPALSPMIFTSNYQPINDSGYNRRFFSIHLSKEEKKEIDEQEKFRKSFEENKKYLSALGDFAADYITRNLTELTRKPWYEVSKDILKALFEFANKLPPKWVDYIEEQRDAVDESNELTHFGLRAFILNKINETCVRFFRNITDESNHNQYELDNSSSKLRFCLQNKLISFLHIIDNDYILITSDIMKELRNSNIENITSLKDIGLLLNFKYTNKNFNGKKMRVLYGNMDTLLEFLDAEIK
jgi:hypothetical protein